MPHDPVSFVVYGKPEPAGSKRAFPIRRPGGKLGVAVSDSNPKAASWKGAVAAAAAEAMRGREIFRGAVEVTMVFYFARPKGHYGTRKSLNALRKTAPKFPAVRPDVLKSTRSVEDALSKIVYVDDSQTVRLMLTKLYGHPARCEITVREMET
jgi:Holliday junction resolvase RusA-like endonuclease